MYDVRFVVFEGSEDLYCGVLYYDIVSFDRFLHISIETEAKATGFYESIDYRLRDYTSHNLQAHNAYVLSAFVVMLTVVFVILSVMHNTFNTLKSVASNLAK